MFLKIYFKSPSLNTAFIDILNSESATDKIFPKSQSISSTFRSKTLNILFFK